MSSNSRLSYTSLHASLRLGSGFQGPTNSPSGTRNADGSTSHGTFVISQFRPIVATTDSASTRIGPQLEVGVAYFDRDWRIFPSTVDESILHPVTRRPSVNTTGDRWKMVGPEAITAAVVYDTFDEMGRRHPYDRRLKANQLARGIETALYEGAENVRIDFGVLGAVRLTSPLFTRATLSSVNLVERVLAIGPPKGHLRWSYIRKVLNSPSLDQRTVPGGTKKRVRRAILLARRQKKGGGSSSTWPVKNVIDSRKHLGGLVA